MASLVVTGLVTLASARLPEKYIATGVGFVFLAATWALVWRRDDAFVVSSGLAFGGLVLPGRLDAERPPRTFCAPLGWALAFGAVTFVPFFFGWRAWWAPEGSFALTPRLSEVGERSRRAAGHHRAPRGGVLPGLPPVAARRRLVAAAQGRRRRRSDLASSSRARSSRSGTSRPFTPRRASPSSSPRSSSAGSARARAASARRIGYHAFCNVFSEALGRGYGVY